MNYSTELKYDNSNRELEDKERATFRKPVIEYSVFGIEMLISWLGLMALLCVLIKLTNKQTKNYKRERKSWRIAMPAHGNCKYAMQYDMISIIN